MSQHVIPPRTYYLVFAALMVLLFATVAAGEINLGRANVPIALAIAVMKMLLIMTWFMHLKYMASLVRVFAGAAFLWLGIGALFTFADYLTRSWHDERVTGAGIKYYAPAVDRVSPGPEGDILVPSAQGAPRLDDR